ncbi:MAG: hypothetical protein JKY56_24120 [Kofleriaceae bacterium]|nr:hypothetical protein [Kofleriaceae bacterium]
MHRIPLPCPSPVVLALSFLLTSACTTGDTGESRNELAEYSDSETPDCTSDSHLCELSRTDLYIAPHDQAYTICFVGDGFENLTEYHKRVDQYVEGMTSTPDGFVAMAPELFSFVRLDLLSLTKAVNNEEPHDTPLAAYLGNDIDACFGPFIQTDVERVALVRENCQGADALVVVVNQSEGRANASGSTVLISSSDDWQVLQHELGHALFGLADEYAEFQHCSERTPKDVSEFLPVPNVSIKGAKWRGVIDEAHSGGGGWPCLYHPTDSCVMLDAVSESFCPVCQAHIGEILNARRCLPDVLAPRVALDWPTLNHKNRSLDIQVVAYDESEIVEYRYYVDAELVQTSNWYSAELPYSSLPSSDGKKSYEVFVEAVDDQNNVGRTRQRNVWIGEAPTLDEPTIEVDEYGWAKLRFENLSSNAQVQVSLGEESFEETGFSPMWFPTRNKGPTSVTIRSTDWLGRSSERITVPLIAPEDLNSDVPVISSATIAGREISDIESISGEADIEVTIVSCSPLDRIEIRDESGVAIASTTITPKRSCSHQITISLPGQADTSALKLTAIDRWAREGSITFPGIPKANNFCPVPVVDTEVASILTPLRISVPGGASDLSTAVWSHETIHTITVFDTTPYILVSPLAIHTIDGRSLDQEEVALRVTVAQECSNVVVASTSMLFPLIDSTPPTLAIQPFGPGSVPMRLKLHDSAGISSVHASWEDGYEFSDQEEPFELPNRGGNARVKVVDVHGNATSRTVNTYDYPSGNRLHCGDIR